MPAAVPGRADTTTFSHNITDPNPLTQPQSLKIQNLNLVYLKKKYYSIPPTSKLSSHLFIMSIRMESAVNKALKAMVDFLLDNKNIDVSPEDSTENIIFVNESLVSGGVRAQETLRRIRDYDSFAYFSLPGALKHSVYEGDDAASEVIMKMKNKKIERKSRVSCEVHSAVFEEDMAREIEQEMNRRSELRQTKSTPAVTKVVGDDSPFKQVRRHSSRLQRQNSVIAHAA